MREKDEIEFSWIAGTLGTLRQNGNEAIFDPGTVVGQTYIVAKAIDKRSGNELSCTIDLHIVPPVQYGPLYKAKIMPGVATVSAGRQKEFHAIAEDADGNAITSGISSFWEVTSDNSDGAEINKKHGDAIIFTAGKRVGQVVINLKIVQGNILKEDFAIINVTEPKEKRYTKIKNSGLPALQSYNDENEYPIKHSWLDTDKKILYYNQSHRDYKDIKNDEKKRQRYIANLYAKELTLIEYKDRDVNLYGERLVEVLSALDRH